MNELRTRAGGHSMGSVSVAFPHIAVFSLKNKQNPPAPGSRNAPEIRDGSIQDFPCREISTGTELAPSSVAVLACTGSPRGAFPPYLLIWKIFQINRYGVPINLEIFPN